VPDPAPVLCGVDGHWHDYGKSARSGRKVGHATICAPDAGSLRERLTVVGERLGRVAQVEPGILALG
jgi:5-(carboxyamino)imidazole ribonucleotide synthase